MLWYNEKNWFGGIYASDISESGSRKTALVSAPSSGGAASDRLCVFQSIVCAVVRKWDLLRNIPDSQPGNGTCSVLRRGVSGDPASLLSPSPASLFYSRNGSKKRLAAAFCAEIVCKSFCFSQYCFLSVYNKLRD